MKRIVANLMALLMFLSGIGPSFAAEISATLPPSEESLPGTPAAFAADSHPWSIAYRDYFLTQTVRQDGLIFSIEESVYQPEQAAELLARVTEDMRIIAAALPIVNKPCTVYVVETPLHGTIQQIGDAVYCTAGDILSGAYRAELIAVMAEIPDYWKAVGLSGVLFGSSIDSAALRDYYEQTDDLDILSLFPAYFLNAFASEEEMLIARDTAIWLTDYIINQYGMDTLLQTDRPEDRQALLYSLGVNRDYSDPYAETLAEYTYAFWKDEYPLAVTTDRGDTIYIRYGEGDLDSPAQVRAFLYEANVGMQAILDGIANEAPEYLQAVLDCYQGAVNVYYDPGQGTGTFPPYHKIMLNASRHYFLQMMYLLIQPLSSDRATYHIEYWKYDGICRYLSVAFYQPQRSKKHYYMAVQALISRYSDPAISANIAAGSEEEHDFRVIQKYQQLYGASTANWMDFDLGLYWNVNAWQITQERLARPDVELEWAPSSGSLRYWHGRKSGGNELFFIQAYSFADYLIKSDGLSAFLKYCLEDTEFEEAFGLSYEEAKEAWIDMME